MSVLLSNLAALSIAIPQGTILYSPFSMSMAMCMVSLGASGETLNEINSAFHCNHDLNNELLVNMTATDYVHIANAMFPLDGSDLNPDFEFKMLEKYDAEVIQQSYKNDPETAREFINIYINNATKGVISNILPLGAVTDQTRNIIINSIILQMKWSRPFNENATRMKLFHVNHKDPEDVMTMTSSELQLLSWKDYGNGVTSIILSLEDPDFSVEFVRPSETNSESLKEAENIVYTRKTDTKNDLFKLVQIPKFNLTSNIDLKKIFMSLGVKKAFIPNEANFTLMFTSSQNESLYISNIYQQTKVGVDENGILAASATAVVVGTTSIAHSDDAKQFILDRPFLALIKFKDFVLFTLRILNPKQS